MSERRRLSHRGRRFRTFLALLRRDGHVARRNFPQLLVQNLLQPMMFVFVSASRASISATKLRPEFDSRPRPNVMPLPIDAAVGDLLGILGSGEVDEGGHEVDLANQMVGPRTSGNLLWPLCDHGNTVSAFVDIAFDAPEITGAPLIELFQPFEGMGLRPVVCGEDHHRVFIQLRHLRRSNRPSTPIVGISATPWKFEGVDCDAFLSKPFSMMELINKVKFLSNKTNSDVAIKAAYSRQLQASSA